MATISRSTLFNQALTHFNQYEVLYRDSVIFRELNKFSLQEPLAKAGRMLNVLDLFAYGVF